MDWFKASRNIFTGKQGDRTPTTWLACRFFLKPSLVQYQYIKRQEWRRFRKFDSLLTPAGMMRMENGSGTGNGWSWTNHLIPWSIPQLPLVNSSALVPRFTSLSSYGSEWKKAISKLFHEAAIVQHQQCALYEHYWAILNICVCPADQLYLPIPSHSGWLPLPQWSRVKSHYVVFVGLTDSVFFSWFTQMVPATAPSTTTGPCPWIFRRSARTRKPGIPKNFCLAGLPQTPVVEPCIQK